MSEENALNEIERFVNLQVLKLPQIISMEIKLEIFTVFSF